MCSTASPFFFYPALVVTIQNGFRSLIVTPGNRSHGRRDPWPNHSYANSASLNLNVCASGGLVFVFTAFLIDRNDYFWWSTDVLPSAQAVALFDSYVNYPVPGRTGGWQGEGFNFLARSTLLMKGTAAQLNTWLNAH